MSPLILFVGLNFLNEWMRWNLEQTWDGWPMRGLFLICQAWTLALLVISVRQAKNLSIDRASTVSFAVAYLSIALYLLTTGI
ncbi:MAG: hypothetical protein ACOC6G_03285 [Thermoproteota archaeon]